MRVSCGSKEIMVSGARTGGLLWIVFASAVIILASFIILERKNRSGLFRLLALSGSVLALSTILYKYISVMRNPHIPFYVPESAIDVDLKPGAVGTILGLIATLLGTVFFRSGSQMDRKEME
jgi:predicted transporter